MASLRMWRQWRARAIIASVMIACLFVLKVLALASSSALARDSADSVGRGASTSTVAAYCGAPSPDNAPTDRRHHALCCILCSAGARDTAPDVIALLPDIAPYASPEPGALVVPLVEGAGAKRPPGWASSWSSRAPPGV